MWPGLRWAALAVGETAILMTPPVLSSLKHLLRAEGGAAERESRRRLGGTVALHAAALDSRIKGVASFAGFTPLRTDSLDKPTGGISR